MPISAKICGLSTPDTVGAAVRHGASHIGFVFFPRSPRNVSIEQAAALAAPVLGRTRIVGLFVDPDPAFVAETLRQVRLDVLQLHGDEPPADVARLRDAHGIEVWKAVPVRTAADLAGARRYQGSASRILYDAKPSPGMDLPGGNGMRFDWKLLEGFDHALPWALSGGLDTANVAEAVSVTGARLVDVSSGVEQAPGVKAVDKIAAFLQATAQL